ncbi:NPCBM/NEW2 domain-containing protein [Actinomyces johnsonii]|uniref:NPCBM/NEW2 domain-containing protein n=1 Tax=Actinomyces johnsonii TaxID=544581 RepID=UPI0028D01196|nr:NPCBM/NEW2 domain-containing protein [Actinomyces johnsonii]
MSSSKPSPARRIATALLPITALSLAACGSLPFSSSSPSSSAPATTAAASPSATPSATASASASASASATASATDTASATASGDPSASASSGTNGLTPENTKGRELRLSDFQQPSSASSWNEKQYDVASSTGVMGIGTDLDWQHNGEIELRLANKFQKVTFNAGQANDSKSSDLTVKVQIFADGKEIDTVNVPFNDAHAFDVDVANVNALKITLTPLDRMQLMPSMGLHTTGVIFNVKAE